MSINYLDGPRLRRSLMAACEYARHQRGELNRINVFPVPDGDTGTNLALTVQAIKDHLHHTDAPEAGAVAEAAAQAAVLGARGNCGMMLSHFLLGFAERVRDRARLTAQEFAEAMSAGVENLTQALENPREGTILTVMRDTARAAVKARTSDFADLVQKIVDEGRRSLESTPDLLPVLRQAGVVDAGAKGFLSLLEGALLFIHGDPVVHLAEGAEADSGPAAVPGGGARFPEEDEPAVARIEYAEERYQFCTEALVRGEALPTQNQVREVLRERGDSLIVIRSGEILKVHVHTDDPEDVFAYLKTVGRLVAHKAEDMRAQHATVERAADGHVRLARRPVTVMTDSACDLPEEIVRAHGIHVTPLLLVDETGAYRDRIDVSAEEFHERLSRDGAMLTTSQPAPADFLETFAAAAEDGEAVLGVILGSSLSGTFSSAEAAATRFHDTPVHLVDSLGISLLEGLLVLKACELAELAWKPGDIVEELKRIRRRSGIVFTLDSFERLLASGRVGRGRAMLGGMLQVKPVLELDVEGKIVPVGKAIGRKRAREALVMALTERIPEDAGGVRFGIIHVGVPEIIEEVSEDLRARWGRDVEILSAPATPVIATHLGLGAWGVAYLVED
ncbi:MAG: DegV family protein [Gemmatimonadota bacterium]